MIVLVAKYQVKPGRGDDVAAALQRMAPLVKASEPGCKLYHACRAQNDPDRFLLYGSPSGDRLRCARGRRSQGWRGCDSL